MLPFTLQDVLPGITIIPSGGEAKRLGELPLEALDATLARGGAGSRGGDSRDARVVGHPKLSRFRGLPEAEFSERPGLRGRGYRNSHA